MKQSTLIHTVAWIATAAVACTAIACIGLLFPAILMILPYSLCVNSKFD